MITLGMRIVKYRGCDHDILWLDVTIMLVTRSWHVHLKYVPRVKEIPNPGEQSESQWELTAR
jgi:hypothetical protein